MRNPCKECDYYHKENNTCQSKKCCTGGSGYITWIDRLFCKPYKYMVDRKTEPQFPRKANKPIRAVWVDDEHNELGKDEPQTEREGE